MTSPDPFSKALAHHQAGRLAEAEALYREIVAAQPGHSGAWHLLGVIAHQVGNNQAAIDLITRAAALNPADAEILNNLGQAWERTKRFDAALSCYERAVTLRPDFAEAHNNLGNVRAARRELVGAIAAYRQALRLRPAYPKAHHNLGASLLETGEATAAAESFRAAIRLAPTWAAPHKGLGDALRKLGQVEPAIAAYEAGLAVTDGDPVLLNNLGLLLREADRLDEAITALENALARQPGFTDAELNLATMLRERGDLPRSLAHFRRALAQQPAPPAVHSNFLFNLHYDATTTARGLLEEHRHWGERFARPLRPSHRPHSQSPDPSRRLRIGYVSADFRQHPVGRNVHPLFAQHDHDAVEIYAYADVAEPDELSARLRQHVDHWREIGSMEDAELAAAIQRDKIDVLVDLSLHTPGNRLLAFARKPAPVAVTFAGYPGTTGLDAIDYRLTDPHLDPPGTRDHLYVERSFRLRDSFWCFDPIEDRIAPRPARRNATALTWGCLNNPIKITEPVFAAWAEILRATPDSRLRVLAHTRHHRARIARGMEQRGVSPQRIEFVAKQPRPAYLAEYHHCDVILDTFPYNGHSTACDALWMGVPVVSCVGETAVGRGGFSLLTNLGLAELAGAGAEAYIRIALELGVDDTRRAALQATLRERMATSPLMDAAGFARQIESAYREMWQSWCEGRLS